MEVLYLRVKFGLFVVFGANFEWITLKVSDMELFSFANVLRLVKIELSIPLVLRTTLSKGSNFFKF